MHAVPSGWGVHATGAPPAQAGTVRAQAPTPQAVQARVNEHVAPLLDSLKALVGIESGSRDLEGLAQAAELVASRLMASGMQVQVLPAASESGQSWFVVQPVADGAEMFSVSAALPMLPSSAT